MWIYGALAKLLPRSRFKTRVRDFCFEKVLFRVTCGTMEHPFTGDLTGRFHRLLFLPNGEYTCELIGYEKHHAIKEGDIVVDAGAYLGHFTVYAAQRAGPTGKVVAFEPDPFVFQMLRRNIQLNNLTNVIAINKGVWSEDTELAFDSRGNASQIVTDEARSKSLVRRIPVVSLDSELQRLGLPRADLIKMDIEGAELRAVHGARRLMARPDCSFAIASYHVVDGKQTSVTLEEFFRCAGYQVATEYPAHLTTYAARKLPPPTHNTSCPLCRTERVVKKKCRFDSVRQCRSCGFIFAVCPTDSSAHDLYEEHWSQTEVHPTFIYSQGQYKVRNEWKLQSLLDRLEKFRQTNRLLDVGCSAAFFLKLARDRKWDVQGVEVSDFGVTFSREKLNIPVFQGFLQDAHFPDESFDAVFSSHVIEHVGDPVSLFKEMNRVLRPGGVLVTILPTQFSSPSYRFFGKWTGEGPPRHVSFFTKHLLETTLSSLGFSICYSRQNVELQKILSLLFRRTGGASGNDVVESPVSAQESSNRFIRGVKFGLNTVATRFGVGDELSVMAVKAPTSTY